MLVFGSQPPSHDAVPGPVLPLVAPSNAAGSDAGGFCASTGGDFVVGSPTVFPFGMSLLSEPLAAVGGEEDGDSDRPSSVPLVETFSFVVVAVKGSDRLDPPMPRARYTLGSFDGDDVLESGRGFAGVENSDSARTVWDVPGLSAAMLSRSTPVTGVALDMRGNVPPYQLRTERGLF